MNNKIQTPYAISKFEEAVRMDEMKGSYRPEERYQVENLYRLRKRKLLD